MLSEPFAVKYWSINLVFKNWGSMAAEDDEYRGR